MYNREIDDSSQKTAASATPAAQPTEQPGTLTQEHVAWPQRPAPFANWPGFKAMTGGGDQQKQTGAIPKATQPVTSYSGKFLSQSARYLHMIRY